MATGEHKKGTTGNDWLSGGDNDTLEGLAGDDTLSGSNNNTYEFSNGDGVDTVYDYSGNNTLIFKGINRAEVRTQKVVAYGVIAFPFSF